MSYLNDVYYSYTIINLQVAKALCAKGYILIAFGGGITGDLQIKDMHLHKPLKTRYRHLEQDLLLQKLIHNPGKYTLECYHMPILRTGT